MRECLSQEYLEFVAKSVEDGCESCRIASSKTEAQAIREGIKNSLDRLGQDWNQTGAGGSRLTDALISACNYCFEKGRTEYPLMRLTCGIRVRLAEKIEQSAH